MPSNVHIVEAYLKFGTKLITNSANPWHASTSNAIAAIMFHGLQLRGKPYLTYIMYWIAKPTLMKINDCGNSLVNVASTIELSAVRSQLRLVPACHSMPMLNTVISITISASRHGTNEPFR